MRNRVLLITLALLVSLTGCSSGVEKTAEQNLEEPAIVYAPTVEPTSAPIPEPTPNHDTPDLSGLDYPFDQMSADWSDDTLDGWYHYEIHEEYARYGGYLPDIVQVYVYALCAQRGIDYYMLLAMIEVESGCRWDAEGASGDYGYLQVVARYHLHRLGESATAEDLLNPYTNISVAVEYLTELSERYETQEEVLTAYNSGPTGAYRDYWSKGITASPYAEKVLEIARRIKEEVTGVSWVDEAKASMNNSMAESNTSEE